MGSGERVFAHESAKDLSEELAEAEKRPHSLAQALAQYTASEYVSSAILSVSKRHLEWAVFSWSGGVDGASGGSPMPRSDWNSGASRTSLFFTSRFKQRRPLPADAQGSVPLKRFRHRSNGELVKLDPLIEFPLEGLDLGYLLPSPAAINTPQLRRRDGTLVCLLLPRLHSLLCLIGVFYRLPSRAKAEVSQAQTVVHHSILHGNTRRNPITQGSS